MNGPRHRPVSTIDLNGPRHRPVSNIDLNGPRHRPVTVTVTVAASWHVQRTTNWAVGLNQVAVIISNLVWVTVMVTVMVTVTVTDNLFK